jgi:hypothetical protein
MAPSRDPSAKVEPSQPRPRAPSGIQCLPPQRSWTLLSGAAQPLSTVARRVADAVRRPRLTRLRNHRRACRAQPADQPRRTPRRTPPAEHPRPNTPGRTPPAEHPRPNTPGRHPRPTSCEDQGRPLRSGWQVTVRRQRPTYRTPCQIPCAGLLSNVPGSGCAGWPAVVSAWRSPLSARGVRHHCAMGSAGTVRQRQRPPQHPLRNHRRAHATHVIGGRDARRRKPPAQGWDEHLI